MMSLQEPVEIVGLGASGVSAARYLVSRGLRPGSMDANPAPAGAQQIVDLGLSEPCVGQLHASRLLEAGTIVLSPGVPRALPEIVAAIENDVAVVGDIELFARVATAPVAAITGSNGKSTVTTLVRDMGLAAGWDVRAGGNLGTPALDLLGSSEPDLYVLELSSFQLESTNSLRASVAAILNVSEDHQDRYQDMRAYVAAKERVLNGAAHAVLPVGWPAPKHCPATYFGLASPARGDYGQCEQAGQKVLSHGDDVLMPVSGLAVPGQHNVANALAALAIGTQLGLARDSMISAITAFTGLKHRCELVAFRHGIRWINDSKGTNVGATVAAVDGLATAGPIVLIAGGLAKGADFTALADAVKGRVRNVLLFGRDASAIDAVLDPCTPRQLVPDLDSAVSAALAQARTGDTVLLSPACASYDMFSSFETRGDAFRTAVLEALG